MLKFITIKELLDKYQIDPINPKDNFIWIIDDKKNIPYPYQIFQDGTKKKIEYMDFGSEQIDIVKFLIPTAPWFLLLSTKEAFSNLDIAIKDEETKLFSYEWTAMFDQLKYLVENLKKNGGIVAMPNIEYLKIRLNDYNNKISPDLPFIRKEFSQIIRNCISLNYKETIRINKNLSEEKQIKLTDRSKNFMQRVALEEGYI